MSTFKQEWDVESALQVLQHPTVDSKIWAEAVEWLLLYGPPEIKELLNQASSHATQESFPELEPHGYDQDGNPCFSVSQLASELGISEEDAVKIIHEKEKKHGVIHLVEDDDISSLQ